MNVPTLVVNVRKVGMIGVIDLSGEVTSAAERPLMEAFALASENQAPYVLLNF
jgi:hypothetical protein